MDETKVPREVDDAKQRELFEAFIAGNTKKALRLLLNENVDINIPYVQARHGRTAGRIWEEGTTCLMLDSHRRLSESELFAACCDGDTMKVITILVTEGINANETIYDRERHGKKIDGQSWESGTTCLMFAASKARFETVKILLKEFHADINQTDKHGNTILHFAVDKCGLDVVRFLCEECNPDLDIKNRKGWTALMVAVRNTSFEKVQYLLNKGAWVNAKNYRGDRALALVTGYYWADEMIKLLKRHGATL